MEYKNFDEAVESIVEKDDRYEAEAYVFIRNVLDDTVTYLKRGKEGTDHHVNGAELCEGARRYALKEYGPVTRIVLNNWGIHTCDDIGAIVFNLIDSHVFGKNDRDHPEDFSGHYTFEEAFEKPFQPAEPVRTARQNR